MIRVLHLTGTSAVGDGVFASLLALYRKIDRGQMVWDCLTFSQNESCYETEWRALGGSIFRLPIPSLTSFLHLRQTISNVCSVQPHYQVAHCHVPALSGPFFSEAKRENIPVRVLHSHSTAWTSGSWRKSLRNACCTRVGQHMANAHLACSQRAADFLFGKHAKSTILPPAIETGDFAFCKKVRQQVRKALNLQGKYVIGHVGRFTPEKNHRFLVEVFAYLHRIYPNSALLLAGDGVCKQSVECLCAHMGLSVRFLGAQQNIAPFLQAMDVFVFPSIFEGFGAVLLEAQAAGLPCVVSDTLPQDAWISSGIHALSLRNDSPERWAKQILAMRNGGRLAVPDFYAEGYNATQAADALAHFYKEGLRRSRQA